MNDIEAFFYSLHRAKIQGDYYMDTNDSKYLDAAGDYLKAASIFINNLKGDNCENKFTRV